MVFKKIILLFSFVFITMVLSAAPNSENDSSSILLSNKTQSIYSEIFNNNCTSCHRPGESGPMSFTSYEEVASMAEMIKGVTESGQMPPWPPDPNYTPHSLLDERFLTEEEKSLIVDWVDQGAYIHVDYVSLN